MDQQQIQTWLGLPDGPWPPDHYTLLGLSPSEADPARIEQEVHTRMELVRRYQLPHPDAATEAMNRLAQAMICLTDPVSRAAYDALLVSGKNPAPPTTAATVENKIGANATASASTLPTSFSRQGLGTRRGLFQRIVLTRGFLQAWSEAGAFLSDPSRVIQRPREATQFIQQMQLLRDLLPTFPPILGAAGRPGYLVLMLARQETIVPTFQTLLPSQRAALARDWQVGLEVLKQYRAFLLAECRIIQGKPYWAKIARVLKSEWPEAQGVLLLLMALVALNITHQSVRNTLPVQAAVFAGYAFLRYLYWWWSMDTEHVVEAKGGDRRPDRSRRTRATRV